MRLIFFAVPIFLENEVAEQQSFSMEISKNGEYDNCREMSGLYRGDGVFVGLISSGLVF
jgi:hypothetical protein